MNFNINQFSSLLNNLGTSTAKMQKDENSIDTKSELNAYVSGWDAIKAKAQNEGATTNDIELLEGDMKSELASLMGAEFGKSAGLEGDKTNDDVVFSEDEISLENMMTLLAPEDDMDINKLREYNKKPLLSSLEEQSNEMDTLNNAGFSAELIDVLKENSPNTLKYISNSIKTGNAERIQESIKSFDGLAQNETDMDILGWIKYDSIDRG